MRTSWIRAAVAMALMWLPASPMFGQRASPSVAQLAAMQKLDAWVGTWSGSGWSLDATGKRTDFKLTETVSRTVGGTVLLIEGHGASAADSSKVTHNGLTLVYFDEHTGHYRWNGHEFASGTVETDARVVDAGLEWSIKAGDTPATVRFTIQFDATRWHEVGDVSMDGMQWNRFMEMNLTRVRR